MRASSRLFHDQRGAHLVEYILVIGLVAVVALTGFSHFGRRAEAEANAQAACLRSLACHDGAAAVGAPADRQLPSAAVAPAPPPPAPQPPEKKGGGGLLDGVTGHVTGIGGGFLHGASSLLTGTWDAVSHPKETAEAVGGLSLLVARLQTGDPTAYLQLAKMGRDTSGQLHAAWKRDPDDFIGRALFEVVTAIAPTKAAKVVHVARASRASRGVELAVATRAARTGAAAEVVTAAKQTQKMAAAYTDPKLWRQLDAAYYRGDQVELPFYFRGDGRDPTAVFRDGFQAGQFEHYDFPVTYASRNPAHAAHYAVRKAETDRHYVYVLRKTDGVLDVARDFPGNQEWAMAYPGGLPPKDVIGAIEVDTPWLRHNNHAKVPREFIPNPQFE